MSLFVIFLITTARLLYLSTSNILTSPKHRTGWKTIYMLIKAKYKQGLKKTTKKDWILFLITGRSVSVNWKIFKNACLIQIVNFSKSAFLYHYPLLQKRSLKSWQKLYVQKEKSIRSLSIALSDNRKKHLIPSFRLVLTILIMPMATM